MYNSILIYSKENKYLEKKIEKLKQMLILLKKLILFRNINEFFAGGDSMKKLFLSLGILTLSFTSFAYENFIPVIETSSKYISVKKNSLFGPYLIIKKSPFNISKQLNKKSYISYKYIL